MNLQEQINAYIITAMKARNEIELRTLRALKAALLLASSEAGASEKIADEQSIKIFQKLAKQRKESFDIFMQNGRKELADKEKEEIDVIEKYLPKQMGEDEIKLALLGVISDSGATSAAEFGKVMPLAMKALAGKADGKIISSILKELLA
ncbi:MAG: GatB/YqeY domain-containing protein [Bacteroidetes bacterium]|nr:GatB/YqeY domain-containing protein [Bacteroidota bacterium]